MANLPTFTGEPSSSSFSVPYPSSASSSSTIPKSRPSQTAYSSSSQSTSTPSTSTYCHDPVTASRSAPPPRQVAPAFHITPSHAAAQPRDDDTGGLVLKYTPGDDLSIPRASYTRVGHSPIASSSSSQRATRTRRLPTSNEPSLASQQQQQSRRSSGSWFHVFVDNTTKTDLAVSHEPPADPSQGPALILSHRAGIDHSTVFIEEYQWQACEQARKQTLRDARNERRSRAGGSTQQQQQHSSSYTPSTTSSLPTSINIDTTTAATPATDLSHVHSPTSPSLKSDRALDEVPPKKSTLPAWSQPRSWGGLVSKDSGATSFTLPQMGDAKTTTPSMASAAPSEIGSPKPNGKAAAAAAATAAQAKPWQPKQRLTLEALLADSHTKFNAPLTVPRGLINKGNFCFANAILQVLIFCAPFYNLFNTLGKELAADFANTTPLIEAVVQFLREFHLAQRTRGARDAVAGQSDLVSNPQLSEPFVPEFVYEAMRLNKRFDLMRRGHQEDAEEFLGFFLDTLHEELLAAMRKSAARAAVAEAKANGPASQASASTSSASASGAAREADADEEREVARPVSPTEEGWMEVGQKGKTAFTRTTSTSESPITRIFGGKLRSVLRTPGAKDSVTLEPYQPLQLDIQPHSVQTIEDALLNLTVPETIPGVFSPARNGPVDATKQVFIERTPPVLILHLKRFFYDEVGGVQKNVKEVGYGDMLEVGGDMVSPTKRLEGSVKYRLFGVVYHHGRYATGGHYTVDVLRQDGSSWVHFDDTMFTPVAQEHVGRKANPHGHGAMANGSGSGPGHDGLAYLLFYKRVDGSEEAVRAGVGATTTTAASAASPAASRSGGKAYSRVNGVSSGHHTRESSASGSGGGAVATNRYASVDGISSKHQQQQQQSPAQRSTTATQPAAAGRNSKSRDASVNGPSAASSSASSPSTTTRSVPGAAPGSKPRKVKT